MKLVVTAVLAFLVGTCTGNHDGDQATLRDCAIKGTAAMFGGGIIACRVLPEKGGQP